jgi:manganese transport protein
MPQSSLSEIHASVNPQHQSPWRRVFAFCGPALLVSIGYMDPGNWATDLQGGSQYGYHLLFVLLAANIMAVVLQSLAARLGIVAQKDLAQINRWLYPKSINYILYGLAEIAIICTDLAEVLGMALGLKLLFGWPLLYGVLLSFSNTFLLLWLQKKGIRKIELFMLSLILFIASVFVFQLVLSEPQLGDIAHGLYPKPLTQAQMYIAIGIIGATVMPHNLYLHSALVQSRRRGDSPQDIQMALKYNRWDSVVALNMAFFVNAAILILAASAFYTQHISLDSITQAHQLLAPSLSSRWAPIAFAFALVAAGQCSTITGTMAGQVVMEGHLQLQLKPFYRQLITRGLAIIPAIIIILCYGDQESEGLLVFSQVILSLQLSFAVIPLIIAVSKPQLMGVYVLSKAKQILAWVVASVIGAANLYWLFGMMLDDFSSHHLALKIFKILLLLGFLVLLILVLYWPNKKRSSR